MAPGTDFNPPKVEVLYTRSGYVGWRIGRPHRGGYHACIDGLPESGTGTTVSEALEDLESQLRDFVMAWDAEADTYDLARSSLDRINRHDEPLLVTWARARLLERNLAAALSCAATPPVRHPADEGDLPGTN